MKNLFQTEYRIAAVYSLAALHAGGRIFHQRQAAIWASAQPHHAFPEKRLGVGGWGCLCDLYNPQMANDLNRSERTVKAALAELENAGLIIRVRQGWNRANRIFLQLPDEVQLSSRPEGKFCPMDGLESSPCMGQNLPISKKEKKKTDSSQNNRRENARRCFGQYQNVFLLDSELAELQSTYPDQYEDYINRLSAYMASSGKHYANHYATIRKWLDEDSKPKPSKNYDYTETYEEGECL